MTDSFDLTGRTALVTGAAGGIGTALCGALAEHGARVVGLDIAPLDEVAGRVRAAGGEFVAAPADLTDKASTVAAVDAAAEQTGSLDILINNAGVYPLKPFEETTLDDWRRIMTLNLDGTFIVTHAALPHLKKGGWGRILNISSATVWMGVPGLVPYVTSKMGLIGFTRTLAPEVGEHGITVNAITPGLIETKTALEGGVGAFFDYVVDNQVIKRRQQPEDLASTVLYLCADGSGFVTGQTINVEGGLTKH